MALLPGIAAGELTSGTAVTWRGRTAGASRQPALPSSPEALNLRPAPSNAAECNRLAEHCLAQGRETGDLRWYLEARKALRKASEFGTTNPVTLRNAAWLATVFHQFDDAIDYAQRALVSAPSDALSYGVLCDAFLETGRYDEAREAAGKMLDLRPGLSSYSRAAHLLWLHGETTGAITLMRDAVEAGHPRSEACAWARTQLAELLFKAGDLAGSARECRLALRFFPGHSSALAGLGRVAAARGAYVEAIGHYKQAAAGQPQIPHLLELGALYRETGETTRALELYRDIEYKVHERERQGFSGDELSLAMLYADGNRNLDTALSLARMEADGHRTVQAYQTLAWVLHRQGKHRDAEQALTQALRLGTREPLLLYHAGKIYQALGDHARMRHSLEAALQMNPQFHVHYADDARACLASASQRR